MTQIGKAEMMKPNTKVQIGDRETTLRNLIRHDIPTTRDILRDYVSGTKLALKPQKRFDKAIDKLNSVQWSLNKPNAVEIVEAAAQIIARVEEKGASDVVYKDY